MSDILQKILARKADEVRERLTRVPLDAVRQQAMQASAPRSFAEALRRRIAAGKPAVIAEIKKASPSQGVIRADFQPAEIARSYQTGGATCLSVLTDVDFFQGADAYLRQAREACTLPVLRKDFVIDKYQILEARALSADAILLIAAALNNAALVNLHAFAIECGLDVLVEVHNLVDLERAQMLTSTTRTVIGINNRDLRTFETDLETTLRLREDVPEGRLLVTESGIHTREAVARMRASGVHAFLVGEAFMRADDPGAELARLFG